MDFLRTGGLLLCLLLFGMLGREARAEQGLDDEVAQAVAAMEEQRWKRAIQLLDEVIQEHSEHLEARYLRGICYGERGKHPTVESRLRDFLGKARQDFDFILERDSLFQDVLYQYARVQRFSNAYQHAILLGQAQVHLKPDLVHAQVGLFKFYWRYVIETPPDEAEQWLKMLDTDQATFFLGEVRRRRGWYRSADTIFEGLLGGDNTVSKSAILLARARSRFAEGNPAAATAFVEQAIAAIRSEVDALLLFDDVKYIATPAEVEAFNHIGVPAAHRRFFETFWVQRNPMPAAGYNARLIEHFRRLRIAERDFLYQGYRSWTDSPYTHDEGKRFPSTYALSSDFDDRGIIFIRHGEPDDFKMGDAVSWLYEDPLLVFHFAPTCTRGVCSVTRHFSPIPGRGIWATRLVGIDPVDAEQKTLDYITKGLISDRHRWPKRMKLLELPYVVAAFRGEGRRTRVEMHYALPLGQLARALDERSDSVSLEIGMSIHTLVWERIGFSRETKRLASIRDRDALVFEHFRTEVLPDSYHVSIHSRSLQKPMLGTVTFDYRTPDFNGPGLKVSDLLLAEDIIELETGSVSHRDDLYLKVNPLGRFSTTQPVFVYFEIYDLALSPEGTTRYSTTYTLTPRKKGRRIIRSGEDGAIALTASEQEGGNRSPIEYLSIDITDVSPGAYTLTVTVRDEQTGDTVERARPLEVQ